MYKLLYIGTCLHMDHLKTFTDINEFIFIDTLPRSEWDDKYYNENQYRNNFYSELLIQINNYGFKLCSSYEIDKNYCNSLLNYKKSSSESYINPTLVIFKNNNTEQIVKYYISTNIEYNINKEIINDIKEADGLIISGYHPNKLILNYFDKPKNLYCYFNTSYKIYEKNMNEEEKNNIINFINTNTYEQISKYFNKVFLVIEDAFIQCENLDKLEDLRKKILLKSSIR